MKVVLLLGSNKGNREEYLENAQKLIISRIGEVIEKTEIAETKPCGIEDRDDFLNQLIAVDTNLFPTELLNTIKEIEKTVGRSFSNRWGEREIDIDILFFEDLYYDSPWLSIPHHQVNSREFVKSLLKDFRSFQVPL